MTLTEFLLARIVEDEAVARAGISSQADPENGWGYVNDGVSRGALTPHVGIIHEAVQAAHITRWHPARVLAECEVKRRIVDYYLTMPSAKGNAVVAGMIAGVGEVLVDLAAAYADHPDYQQEWAV